MKQTTRLKGLVIASSLLILLGCNSSSSSGRLTIGLVSYGEGERAISDYKELRTYLGRELNSLIEFEPTLNELKATEQIQRQIWDIVFASPGLAAIAVADGNYIALFPLEGGLSNRSVIVVSESSPIQSLKDLSGKRLALSQQGSATGYYFPVYNLYGLTLAQIRFSPVPKTTLEWIANGEVDVGAMSLEEYKRHRLSIDNARFRVLYTDSHNVPNGALLVSIRLEEKEREKIRQVLKGAPPSVTSSAGYIPNAPVPNYDYMIRVVQRVRPIAERIKQQPAPLYEQKN